MNRYGELRREAERLEASAYYLRKTVSTLDDEAWNAAARAAGALEQLADRLRVLERIENGEVVR
jgi:hypothetical protein